MSEIANESSESITSFRETLYTFNKDAQSTATQATTIENTTYITLAKIDHIMYKSSAYKNLVNGRIQDQLGSHHECNLGKWYESKEGKARFSHLDSYKQIDKPHSTIHEMVHKNLKFIEQEDRSIEHQDEIIENFHTMEDASQVLFNLMDNLIHESEKELCKK